MSKTTLALIAGVSAFAGAATTAAIYSSQRKQTPVVAVAVPKPTSPTPPSAPLTAPMPSTSIPAGLIAPVDPAGLFQYGFPGPTADLHPTPSTISCLDRRTRNPHWVAEHFTAASLAMNNADRRHSVFVEDVAVPAKFRAKLTDYFRSGYDRGHQVPAADAKWSQQAMDGTFLLTNMCPQVGDGFNRDYWAHFEDFCRRLTGRYPSVRIVTGPLYLPKKDADGKWRVSYEMIGNPPNVAVPTHFYKVIFAEEQTGVAPPSSKVALGAFVLPNAPIDNNKPLSDFEVPIEAVERASGLEFGTKLPIERRKRLCGEVDCRIIARVFSDAQRNLPKNGKRPNRDE